MNLIFFGTSEFAEFVLKELLGSRHKILAVVTQPDKPKGRRLHMSEPPVKALAVSCDIQVYQPLDASSRESMEYLKRFNADLFIVVAFGQILKKELLGVPRLYALNLHASLLPKYRGAAPTNWAIINGDKLTGVTVIRMNEKMDEGDIILKREILIDDKETNITLNEKLADIGSKVLIEALDLIESGRVKFEKQDSREATLAPKLTKEDGLIDWNESAARIHNKVRGLLPWPTAYTHLNGKMLKILKTKIASEKEGLSPSGTVPLFPRNDNGDIKPGTIIKVAKEGILVATGSGAFLIEYVQLEGGKEMDSAAFLRGHRLEVGQVFGK